MPTFTLRRAAGLTAAALIALTMAACSSSGSSQAGAAASSGKAAVSSALANPTTSADIQAAEALLLANYQKEIKVTPAHPYDAAKRAIKDTFPSGNTDKIIQFGVGKFTVTMIHSKTARLAWYQEVAAYALANGGSTASPGSANIPGVTTPASPSATGSTP